VAVTVGVGTIAVRGVIVADATIAVPGVKDAAIVALAAIGSRAMPTRVPRPSSRRRSSPVMTSNS
jgi:hypothetical protein